MCWPYPDDHETKAWGEKRIRYPRIPRPKRCALAVGSIDPFRGLANALSAPPGKYGRKAKTQRNRRELAQAVVHAVQFDGDRGTSPGFEMAVKCGGNSACLTRTLSQVLHGPRQFVM